MSSNVLHGNVLLRRRRVAAQPVRKKSFDAEHEKSDLEQSIMQAQKAKRAAESPSIGPRERPFSPLKRAREEGKRHEEQTTAQNEERRKSSGLKKLLV